jgi:hypothetical protein
LDDLDARRGGWRRVQPEEARGAIDVYRLEVQVAVWRRETVGVRAAQRDHEMASLSLLCRQEVARHLGRVGADP